MNDQQPKTNLQKAAELFTKYSFVLQWAVTIFVFFGGWIFNFHDSNRSTAQDIDDLKDGQTLIKNDIELRSKNRSAEIKEINDTMVKKDVFDERTKAILDQMMLLRQDFKDERDRRMYSGR